MRHALTIAAKDLVLRIRDRSAFVVGILVPFGLALILSTALGSEDAEDSALDHTYGVVDLDGGVVGDRFVNVVQEIGFARVVPLSSVREAEARIDGGRAVAVFVIPEGFTEDAQSGEGSTLLVLGDPDAPIGTQIADAVARAFASELNAARIGVAAVVGDQPMTPEALQDLAERAAATDPVAVLDMGRARDRIFDSATYFAVGMAVFFVFFSVEFGVRSLLEERQEGTLARLLAAPIPRWAVIGGKAAASFVVGLTSMVVLVAATTLLLNADWGNVVGVAALVLCAVLAAMGLTALVATLATTPEQAGSYTSVLAVVLGLLGGTFFPISQAGGILAGLSLLSPHAWLMRGFGELAGGGAGVTDVLPSIGAVLAFGAIAGVIAVVRARRLVVGP